MKKRLCIVLVIEASLVTTVTVLLALLWSFFEPLASAFSLMMLVPLGVLLIIQIFFCAILCKQPTARKRGLLTLLALPLAIIAIKATHLDLRLNCAVLAKERIKIYSTAQQAQNQQQPDTIIALPEGKEYLAFDGIQLLGKDGGDGAAFYYARGLLDEAKMSALLYLPSGMIDNYKPPQADKWIQLNRCWFYVMVSPEDALW
jgi:D-alanyl-lipoteichoic acid acyltransferase DltB (MBOAT superfamily)